jgi:cyclophilin family peptidyl-prolyl cis-trans isomerase
LKTKTTIVLGLVMILLLAGCLPPPMNSAPESTAAPTAESAATTVPAPEATSAATEAAAVSSTPDARPAVPAPVEGQRPLASVPPAERANAYSGPAPTSIKPGVNYVATIVTDKGNIVAELYADTPESTNNFVTLAENGFYDGLTFHRVVPNFVAQGGDPLGDGTGDPGYTIPAEINHNHVRGSLAWARTSDQVNPERRSSGSQFYIALDALPDLDGQYTVFGQVVEGMEIVDQIKVGDKIQRIDISEAEVSRALTPLPSPTIAPTPTPYAPTSQEGRPLAQLPVEKREGVYNMPPAMTIDKTKTYQATIETAKGTVVMDLDASKAPNAVNNFMVLANLGFYDNMPVTFVQPGAYAIMGSPAGQPQSDIGYQLDIEPDAAASEVVTGTVAYYPAAALDGSIKASGSQILITFMSAPQSPDAPLDVFGTVTQGMEVLAQLQAGDLIMKVTVAEKQ